MPSTAFFEELFDDCPVGRIFRRRVLVDELLVGHELPADDDQGGGEEDQRESEREPEVLRLCIDRVECVHDDERDRGQGGEREQPEYEALGAIARVMAWDQALSAVAPASPAGAPDEQHEAGDEPVFRPSHGEASCRSPGKTRRAPHPEEPGHEPFGDRPDVTERPAAAIIGMLRVVDVEDERVELRVGDRFSEKEGITYGPMRTASAIWVFVASRNDGGTAPVT